VVHNHSRREWQFGMDHTVAVCQFIIHAKNGERVWRAILWSKLKMNILNCCIIAYRPC
jgi:hypothetical protein